MSLDLRGRAGAQVGILNADPVVVQLARHLLGHAIVGPLLGHGDVGVGFAAAAGQGLADDFFPRIADGVQEQIIGSKNLAGWIKFDDGLSSPDRLGFKDSV